MRRHNRIEVDKIRRAAENCRKMSSKLKKKQKSTYKSCFVPKCRNSTTRTPGKIFLCVPNCDERRQVWSMAAGYIGKLRLHSYICEDHFKLDEDLENYTQWKMMNCRKKMKPSAYPRFFACQMDPNTDSQSSTKARDNVSVREPTVVQPVSTVWLQSNDFSTIEERPWINYGSPSADQWPENPVLIKSEFVAVKEEMDDDYMECLPAEPINERTHSDRNSSQIKNSNHSGASYRIFPVSCGVQTDLQLVDRYVQVRPAYKSIGTTCRLENLPVLVKSTRSSSRKETRATKVYGSDESSGDLGLKMKNLLLNVFETTTKLIIEHNPFLFLGLPPDAIYVLDEVTSTTEISVRDIYLTLKKIRHNIPNALLAYEFGFPKCDEVSEVFRITVSKLAEKFYDLIVWPSKQDIVQNLPVEFRPRHSNVQSIIDCFEIQIEKSTDDLYESMLEGNTTKYFISVTPDGLINFISSGFDAHSSDTEIIINSGFLDALPPDSEVLANRGFRQVDMLLQRERSKLWKTSESDDDTNVNDAKPIGSVRMERVIKSLREFKMLDACVSVDFNLRGLMDNVVIIAAAIVNLQSKIMK